MKIKGLKTEEIRRCLNEGCGKMIEVIPGNRKKRFCSMKCYKTWWDEKNKEHKKKYDKEYRERRKNL